MKTRIFLPSLLCVLSAGMCLAQEDRAVLTGTITDPSKSAISGASVEVSSKATGFHREVKTSDLGAFSVPSLLIGVYDIKISKEGFRTQATTVELVVGQIRTVDAQ